MVAFVQCPRCADDLTAFLCEEFGNGLPDAPKPLPDPSDGGSPLPHRQIVMVGFLQAQNCSNYPASWRHSESAGDFMSPAYYGRIARALEDGKFHLGFFDDRLAMPDIYGANHAESVSNGVRVVKMDPEQILATMAMSTKCLGLEATC